MHDQATLPTTPGAIIGHRKTGQPIRLIAGGSEPGGAPAPGGQAPAPPAPPAGTGQTPATGTAGDPAPQPTASQPQTFDEAYVKTLRDEAAANRVKARDAEAGRQALLDAIAKATGQTPANADPVKLAEQLTTEQATARQARVELAVYRVAGQPGVNANADALLDSRAVMAKLTDLDPTAADFTEKVTAAIKDAVTANPALAAAGQAPAPQRSGGEFTGGTGAGAPITEAQLAAMSPEEITKAYSEGKLAHLM